nr:hypothetical protein [Tanacetum cinerariifolium]
MENREQALPQQQMAKNPVPFTHAKQVGFKIEDVILNSNNEVALLYPEHSNKEEYLSKFWYSTKALDNYKVYVSIPTSGIYRELGVNTFRKAIGADYLSHSSDYVDPPFIDMVRPWFLTIRYGEEVFAKGTLKKSLLPLRWRLLMAQIILCLGGKTGGFDQITNKDAIIMYCLANGFNINCAMIFWEDIINKLKKKNREKDLPLQPTWWQSAMQSSLWLLKLLEPPHKLRRRFPKAQSLELKLDIISNQLLLKNLLCPAVRQQKAGLLKHPPVPKLASLGKEKSPARP